jgi:hypothetical protein
MNDFVQWCQTSGLSAAIRSTKWTYPSIEILHIAGVVLVFGSILVLNLRIFDRVLWRTPVKDVALGLAPLTLIGLCAQCISGPLLFVATAMRFWENPSFGLKLLLLAVALFYHYGMHRPMAISGTASVPKLRWSAALSMLLWISVILAGLSIELLAA